MLIVKRENGFHIVYLGMVAKVLWNCADSYQFCEEKLDDEKKVKNSQVLKKKNKKRKKKERKEKANRKKKDRKKREKKEKREEILVDL